VKEEVKKANKWFDNINSNALYSELWRILSVEARLELYEEYKKLVEPKRRV